jgi:hypothetical protein
MIEAASSMRQFHSMPMLISPSGTPGEPSRRTRPGDKSPNSRKMAEPYPLQRQPSFMPTRSPAMRLNVVRACIKRWPGAEFRSWRPGALIASHYSAPFSGVARCEGRQEVHCF